MSKTLAYLDRSVSGSTLVLAFLIVQAAISTCANAASANGQASATAIGEVISQPSIIILQAPRVVTSTPLVVTSVSLSFDKSPLIDFSTSAFISSTPQAAAASSPSRLRYITTPSISSAGAVLGNAGPNGSSLASLIDVNDEGVVTFSVTSATATTGVSVQLPVAPGGASNQRTIFNSSSLILPAQAISDGGRLAVELRGVLNDSSSDPVNLEVSYN